MSKPNVSGVSVVRVPAKSAVLASPSPASATTKSGVTSGKVDAGKNVNPPLHPTGGVDTVSPADAPGNEYSSVGEGAGEAAPDDPYGYLKQTGQA